MEMTKPNPEEKPAAPQVNDITAPVGAPAPAASSDQAPTDTPAPAEGAPADGEKLAEAPAEDTETDKQPEVQAAEVAKQPKVSKPHGPGMAIFAAVIVVLALGAMFTYAYLQSQ
jgi:hypothetical protein